jgi:hypothetical protein
MSGFGVAFERKWPAGKRVPSPENDNVLFREEVFRGGSFFEGTSIREEANREVDYAVAEVGFGHGEERIETSYLEADVGRFLG